MDHPLFPNTPNIIEQPTFQQSYCSVGDERVGDERVGDERERSKRSWTTMREGKTKRVPSLKGEKPPPPVEYKTEDGTVFPSRSAFKKHMKKMGKLRISGLWDDPEREDL